MPKCRASLCVDVSFPHIHINLGRRVGAAKAKTKNQKPKSKSHNGHTFSLLGSTPRFGRSKYLVE